MPFKTISKILRSNISQTIVAALKISASGGVLFNSDVLARSQTSRHSPAGSQFSTERENSDLVKMELYLKAGADGQSVGDCPFAHYVRWLIVVDDDLVIWVLAWSLPLCPLSL